MNEREIMRLQRGNRSEGWVLPDVGRASFIHDDTSSVMELDMESLRHIKEHRRQFDMDVIRVPEMDPFSDEVGSFHDMNVIIVPQIETDD
jgi:hypothetical protein